MLKVTADKNVVGPWVCERLNMIWNPRGMYAFGTYDPDLGPLGIRGGIVLEAFSGVGGSVLMHVASDFSRSWLTRDFLFYIFDFCFNVLKVKKVIGLVRSTDTAVLEFDRRIGFTEETIIAGLWPNADGLVLKMDRDECRWINERFWPASVRALRAA